MELFKKTIQVDTAGAKTTYVNVTTQVNEVIAESGIQDGLCAVITPHTTCSVFYEEFTHDLNEDGDEFLQSDLNKVLDKIIPLHTSPDVYDYPGEEHYRIVEAWPNVAEYLPDGDRSALWNGDAHLKSTLLGSSEVFDVTENALGVGSTGYIYFVDFDQTRARTRNVQITVIGK